MVAALDGGLNVLKVVGSIPDEFVLPSLFKDPYSIAKELGWVMGNRVGPLGPVRI